MKLLDPQDPGCTMDEMCMLAYLCDLMLKTTPSVAVVHATAPHAETTTVEMKDQPREVGQPEVETNGQQVTEIAVQVQQDTESAEHMQAETETVEQLLAETETAGQMHPGNGTEKLEGETRAAVDESRVLQNAKVPMQPSTDDESDNQTAFGGAHVNDSSKGIEMGTKVATASAAVGVLVVVGLVLRAAILRAKA
jgi:hypothetical protein